MTSWEYGILAAAILLCAAAIWCERRKTRRTLEKLNEMLTDAMRGDFTEDSFDETLLSALESKLAHYLAASTVSARNVSTEKEKLKTLIGDISHQTKTPIANILLYAQLLREQPGNVVCLDALDAQTRKLQSLIEALVKTSRLESGVIALRRSRGRFRTFYPRRYPSWSRRPGKRTFPSLFFPRMPKRFSTQNGRRKPYLTCWTMPSSTPPPAGRFVCPRPTTRCFRPFTWRTTGRGYRRTSSRRYFSASIGA